LLQIMKEGDSYSIFHTSKHHSPAGNSALPTFIHQMLIVVAAVRNSHKGDRQNVGIVILGCVIVAVEK
jgi:hypothetical protein